MMTRNSELFCWPARFRICKPSTCGRNAYPPKNISYAGDDPEEVGEVKICGTKDTEIVGNLEEVRIKANICKTGIEKSDIVCIDLKSTQQKRVEHKEWVEAWGDGHHRGPNEHEGKYCLN